MISARGCLGFVLWLAAAHAQGPQYVISTYAGGGPPPTPARGLGMWFDFAQAVVPDPAGNLYFSALHCVFKLDTSGIVARVAGTGKPGFSGDGRTGSSAQLNHPSGLALDAAGNLFIADTGNLRIRKVSPDGIITTVAGDGTYGPSGDGGLATSAQLGYLAFDDPHPPNYVAVDGTGSLFIADYNRIRIVTPDGIIKTLVQNVSGPLVVDSGGNLFVANYSKVVGVSPDGTTTTVAGGGPVSGNTLGWTGVSSIACIDDLSGDGGQATQAGLCNLTGIAVDAAGNLFLGEDFYFDLGSDNWAFAVRKMSPDGIITTVAGRARGEGPVDGGSATAGPIAWGGAVAVDGSGNLFIADAEDIRKISPDGIINTVAGAPVCARGDDVCYQSALAWRSQQHFSGDGGPA
jgi:hypothetical protein